MFRYRSVLMLTAGVLVVGLFVALVHRRSGQVADAPSALEQASTAMQQPPLAVDHIAVHSRQVEGHPEPLPALDTPLAEALVELEGRAKLGDRTAACRLVAERQYCATLPSAIEEHDRWLGQRKRVLDSINDDEGIRKFNEAFDAELEQREQSLSALSKHCQGVDGVAPRELINEWRQAAHLRSPAAMRNYASGGAFQWSTLIETADQLEIYRREAEKMARVLAGWGDAEMTLALASAYSPYTIPGEARSLLGQVVKPDAALSWGLFKRLHQALERIDPAESIKAAGLATLVARELSQLELRMSESERVRATEYFEAMTAAWYPIRAEVVRDHVYPGGHIPPPTRAACGRTRGP